METNSLYHHGILGQKWGTRNGPPYPLGAGDHSSAEKKAGWKKSLSGRNESKQLYGSDGKKKKGHIAKDVLGIGLSTVTLNPIGIGLHAKSIVDAVNADKKVKENDDRLNESKIDEKTGLHLKASEMTEKQDMKAINPGFKNYDTDTKMNCMNCTTAYELRRRGFDVVANKRDVGYGSHYIEEYFPGSKTKTLVSDMDNKSALYKAAFEMNYSMGKRTYEALSKEPSGSRGNLLLWFIGGGHSVAYEVNDGKVVIRDCQTNKTYDTKNKITNFLCTTIQTDYIRTDNADIDFEKIKRAVH